VPGKHRHSWNLCKNKKAGPPSQGSPAVYVTKKTVALPLPTHDERGFDLGDETMENQGIFQIQLPHIIHLLFNICQQFFKDKKLVLK